MDIPSKYDPAGAEGKWYRYWMEKGFFHSTPDEREAYSIVIPPPNVTGVLHMGHMLNNTAQDVLIRRARMMGYNACWVPGTDHASIATEAKVVAKLKAEGISKTDLTRDEFLEHAWEWTHKHGGIILEQLKRLGASCDWERTLFTMDEKRYESVIKVFTDLYNKGLIYRGVRMVNWDPQAQTAVSDEEVIYTEENSKLYYVRYKIVGEDNYVMVATTRPETILGDTAICANPDDERYFNMKGKKVIVPMTCREVPFIFDSYVDPEFGTGCLKITPAHDINDYEIGIRHKLQSIDIFNDNGTINERAGLFAGVDRFVARDLAEKELEKSGALVKVENYKNKVGRSERTNSVIEPKLSMQWFLKMADMVKPALAAVNDGVIRIHPDKYKNVYRHWMENVRDWCISRQLWWGHRIPAYYYNATDYVVAETVAEAVEKARTASGNAQLTESDLRQDEDVLDTWFSSWLWPLTSFDAINNPGNADFNYYYPTKALVTAPEILFFWVARMIMAGYEYAGKEPFSDVYLTGIVRDKQRRKMSKSLGNSPDPISLIEQYSADGVRIGMLFCSPAGNDLLYDDSLPEQGRNFTNKIWNAFRLIKSMSVDESIPQPEASAIAVKWMDNILSKTLAEIDDNFNKYRISDALMQAYKLFWDEFSGWYLEIIKPDYQKPIDIQTYKETIGIFNSLLKILHPFMPFITEEIWHLLEERADGESIMIEKMPVSKGFDANLISNFETVKAVISDVRTIRKEKNIKNAEKLTLLTGALKTKENSQLNPVIIKLCNLASIDYVSEKVEGAASFRVSTTEYYVPVEGSVDKEAELKKLREELSYTEGFLALVLEKLNNEKFTSHAPAKVIEMERKKQSDAESKIETLKAGIVMIEKNIM